MYYSLIIHVRVMIEGLIVDWTFLSISRKFEIDRRKADQDIWSEIPVRLSRLLLTCRVTAENYGVSWCKSVL